MSAGIIILAIVLFLLLAAGIGVGLYFALRKKSTPPGPTGPATSGATGINNGPPSGGVTGDFSIRSVHDPTQFITFVDSNDISTEGNMITSSENTVPCSNYSWRNVGNISSPLVPNNAISSALISNATRIGNIPPPFAASRTNVAGTSQPPFDVVVGDILFGVSTIPNYVWNYNATNKTWCGSGSLANNCLYLENNKTVKARTLNATNDTRFQWENVTPVSSPNCL